MILEMIQKNRLRELKDNQCVVVDGEKQSDLDQLSTDILTVAQEGKKIFIS